jgi:hypothetical protein
MRGALIMKDRNDLPTVGGKAGQYLSSKKSFEVRLLDNVLRAYLARRKLALPDPATDRLRVTTRSAGGLWYGEHVL